MSPENRSNEGVEAIRRRWSRDGGMGNDRSAEDYTGAGCRALAENAFGDVASLLAQLAAVERERDSLRAENNRLRGIILALDNDADQALIDRDEAIEAESQAGDRIAAEREAAIAENARLLARIAAVEAILDRYKGAKANVIALDTVLAALAASPTPTGPEPATYRNGPTCRGPFCDHESCASAERDYHVGPATPTEPTEETP